MKNELRQKATNDFENDFFKTMENVRNYKDIKLVKTERRRSYLVSEPNFHTMKFYSKKVLAIK